MAQCGDMEQIRLTYLHLAHFCSLFLSTLHIGSRRVIFPLSEDLARYQLPWRAAEHMLEENLC